jgi:hypothetical protein
MIKYNIKGRDPCRIVFPSGWPRLTSNRNECELHSATGGVTSGGEWRGSRSKSTTHKEEVWGRGETTRGTRTVTTFHGRAGRPCRLVCGLTFRTLLRSHRLGKLSSKNRCARKFLARELVRIWSTITRRKIRFWSVATTAEATAMTADCGQVYVANLNLPSAQNFSKLKTKIYCLWILF